MKLRKAKRFNTVESYAACICVATTCSCDCDCNGSQEFSKPSSRNANSEYSWNHYDADASYYRG